MRDPEPSDDIPLPERKYHCIVIDPPWPVAKIEREERPRQGKKLDYPVMSLEAIEQKIVAVSKDNTLRDGCHFYLWVTHKFLPAGLRIFEAAGIKYQCLLTWCKPVGITPFSWMYNSEHVLFGTKGGLKILETGVGQKVWFGSKPGKHSTKPDIFFERVRLASPEPRLEMFQRASRDGFDGWGNEVS
jgi:N6-adenosine-specific RNA methylase IME4